MQKSEPLDDENQIYRIEEGVRRAKAALVTGKTVRRAQIRKETGGLGPEVELRLDQLVSSKPVIEMSGEGFNRWRDALRAARNGVFDDGSPILPIDVSRKTYGTPLQDVIIEGEDELEQFRLQYE